MNKQEIVEKIASNVDRIIGELEAKDRGNGITERTFEVLITVENGRQINTQSIFVVDEGLETESASFMNGREVKNFELLPPNREQKLLAHLEQLETQGPVKGIDLSNLGISFAELEVAGTKLFVAELADQLKTIESI